MKEIIRDLESGQVTPQTVDKQERILSRMLDGSQSLSKQDFTKRRIAEREEEAKSRPSSTPGVIPRLSIPFSQPDFSLYPEEYHDLIRKYLQSLKSE
jgi:hypothetical protein